MLETDIKVIQPQDVVELDEEFTEAYHDALYGGLQIAKDSKVVVVGLARQIAPVAPLTVIRLSLLSKRFREFAVVVVENDSTDETVEIFEDWHPDFPVHIESSKLDRPHLPAERSADRTQALAEYRNRCVEIVREKHADADFVIVMDYDAWGGFLSEGIMTSLYYLSQDEFLYGLGSVGLSQIDSVRDKDGKPLWINYDAWAHRPTWSWRQRPEMWYHLLVPPFGGHPINVNSCFGGLAVYNTDDYLTGIYGGTLFGIGDCEHVVFHRSISQQSLKHFALNPSSVGVMFWKPEEPGDGS